MPASRGADFRPLGGREPADWQSRWSRLESAASHQVILPPVELLRAGGDYWVVDGHNRVALAKELGQLWIDADITELDLGAGPGPPMRQRRTDHAVHTAGERGPRVSRIAFGNWSAGGDWGHVDRGAAIAAPRRPSALGSPCSTRHMPTGSVPRKLLGEALAPEMRVGARVTGPMASGRDGECSGRR